MHLLVDTACIQDLVHAMSTLITSATTNCLRNFLVRINIWGRQHVILRRPGFHHGFFFGHRVIGVPSSSAVIWSHPGVMRGFTVPYPERIINEGILVERPLISIMLHYRYDLELSPQQVPAEARGLGLHALVRQSYLHPSKN
jgi:hypothetical protein